MILLLGTEKNNMWLKELILVALLAITLVEANPDEAGSARRNNRHRELLKPETNAIDHGPNNLHHKSDHLLGHRGEQHWGLKKNKKRNMMRKYKKKANHSSGSHHDSLDDIRLQDLSYVPPKSHAASPTASTLKKTHHNNKKELKAIHNKNYLRKLKQWKAKMMSKRKNGSQKGNHLVQHP